MAKIFDYIDYRAFLKDQVEEIQKKNPQLSLTKFCKSAGFASTGALRFIVTGKRDLTVKSLNRLSKALKLTAQEKKFLELLVQFSNATDTDVKTKIYEQIIAFKPYQGAHPLEKEQYYYYSSWLIPALRELVALKDFKEDPQWIASQFLEPAKPADIRAGLQILINLGLISRDPTTKKLKQVHAKVSSPEVARGICYLNFFKNMANQAYSSIERLPARNRELSTLTLSLSFERFQEMKEDLLKFKQEMFEKYGEATEADNQIFQMNLQFFPLTRYQK